MMPLKGTDDKESEKAKTTQLSIGFENAEAISGLK